MSIWNDVYFRANVNDNGDYPSTGCQSSCFDIITRQAPLKNPDTLIRDDWNNNVCEELNARMNNYIYVRGRNLAGKKQTGKVYLYYSKANLLLYPSFWQDNVIKVGGNKDCFDFSVEKDGKFLCSDSSQGTFAWAPEMITNNHYCLISRAVTEDHPAPIPSASDVVDFGRFISTNRSYGWRNVTVIDRNTADISQTVHYDQGETSHTMHIILSCKDVPVGAEVAFDCVTPGPKPMIHMERTKITTPNQDVGIICDVPANFSGDITYYYWANGKKPGDNFKISLHCVIFTSENHELRQYAKHYEELGFALPHSMREQMKIGNSIGPEYGIILGEYSSQMKK